MCTTFNFFIEYFQLSPSWHVMYFYGSFDRLKVLGDLVNAVRS